MYRTILVIIIGIYLNKYSTTIASVQVPQPDEDDLPLRSNEKIEQFQLPKDQIPLVRLPSNTLLKYTAYKDVSILHFRIPSDTRTALFTFKAYEESKSAFQRLCQPRDVTLHLKAGSYPVISPENITFPRNFLTADQRFKIYNLQFKSNGRQQRLTIDGPISGNWFAVAFISWTDPSNDRIEQQGLAASCETLLLSEMSVARIIPIILQNGQILNNTLTSDFNSTRENGINSYKFYVPRYTGIVTAHFIIGNICSICPDIGFYIQANAIPSSNMNYIHSAIIKPNQSGEISFEFYVQSDTWHYIDIKFEKQYMNNNHSYKNTSAYDNWNEINLMKMDNTIQKIKNQTRTNLHTEITPFGTTKNLTTNMNTSNDNVYFELEYSIQLDYHTEEEMEIEPDKPIIFRDIEFYPLLRQTYREFFMFDYDLIPDVNGSVPTILNITASQPVGFRFEVGDVYDIGGTLSFGISMKRDIKGNDVKAIAQEDSIETDGILAERLVDRPIVEQEFKQPIDTEDDLSSPRSNQTIIICMRLGEPGEPKWPDKCKYGQKLLPASGIINNTDPETSTGVIHVPFPESGQWFVTMGLYCHGAETAARITIIDSVKDFVKKYSKMLDLMKPPCSCANQIKFFKQCIADKKCFSQMNETETLKIKECLMDSKCTADYLDMTEKFEIHHKFATEQSVATENCNTSLVFTISSSPCVGGRCGRYGRCYHYMSGGFVFSTCLCMKGYQGWHCSEDSQVPSSFSILVASLLLTLSNLLFIPSIYFAVKRKYHTESVIYFFAMFFSIFYHACDSGEDEYSFCLVKISVLQFCDFYCGLLAIWVTLIAMAHIRQQFVSLLHMMGAIVLAFGTELNKQSLWVFLAPALTGICLISVSWGLRCRKTRKWFPSKRYLTIFMPIGALLAMVGLLCYAFAQTKQNYHIVHSIWHMIMALALLCLLPSENSFLPKC